MFSVVIPTMWKFRQFERVLPSLLQYEKVGEVILFNNDPQKTPESIKNMVHPKLKVFDFGRNIGVNPAWNMGVWNAKFDNICILNDDVVFDFSVFDLVEPLLSDPNTGVIGMNAGVKDLGQPLFSDGYTEIQPWQGEHTCGFGCLFFIHKNNYHYIPEALVIYYGDNFIFDICLLNKKTNYIITNLTFYTPFATTVGEVGKGYMDIETPLYYDIMERIKKNGHL